MREMKDSGVGWIGEIPKEWIVIKNKYVSKQFTGNSIKDEEKSNYTDSTDAIAYISSKDINVQNNTVNYNNGMYIKNEDQSFKVAHIGDTLMCIEGGSAGKKKAFLQQNVCFVNKLCCFHPININNKFLYYILNSPHYEAEFNFNISGLIGGVTKSNLNNFIIPLPSSGIQQKIADYLDDKCAKIDTFIEKQQAVIKKLEEYLISIVNEIIVDVEGMSVHLGFISTMKNGLNFNLVTQGKKIKFLGVGDFKQHFILDDEDMFSDIMIEEEIDEGYFLKNGDIIFVRSNGSKDLVGRVVMVENVDYPLTYSGFCIRFRNRRPDILSDKYLLYFFRSPYFRKQLEKYSQGSNISNINQDLLSQIQIKIPSMEIQFEALNRVENIISQIDEIIRKKQAIISKLAEYKKSLIYEVVTGKKEVC